MSNSLPLALDSFVGRSRELERVRELLTAARLVTVTGPPGIGKTRLALELAAQMSESYPDGILLVDLAPVTDGELVAQTVAAAFGVRENAEQGLTETLVGYLRDRHLLLVVDNCEHLLVDCAVLAERILHAVPKVSMLLTSRERLDIRGEHVLNLGPLSLPASASGGEDDDVSPATSEAVALFVERAEAVQPGFSISHEAEHTSMLVAEICRRADGVPLAIELVAARVPSLSLPEIAARMAEGSGLLSGNLRSSVARHHSMQVALDWSNDRCGWPAVS